MPSPFPIGGGSAGGIILYPRDRLYQEMAYIAFHFHWDYSEIMQMEHRERQRWVEEVASINTQLNMAIEEE